jgi:hypothetical protein
MPLEIRLPWMKAPSQEEQEYETKIAEARGALDAREAAAPERLVKTPEGAAYFGVPIDTPVPRKKPKGAPSVVYKPPSSVELDALLLQVNEAAMVAKQQDSPGQRIYFDEKETVERLDLILREYNSRNTGYDRMTMGAWLYAHGVRINP